MEAKKLLTIVFGTMIFHENVQNEHTKNFCYVDVLKVDKVEKHEEEGIEEYCEKMLTEFDSYLIVEKYTGGIYGCYSPTR